MKTTKTLSVLMMSLVLGCTPVPGDPGPKGDPGPPGPMGAMGMPGAPGSSATTFPDCPIGYDRDQSIMNIVLCKQGADEVVKVGSRGSAFWIDRYEASVWQSPDGSGTQYGVSDDQYPVPKNGQWWRSGKPVPPMYALSTTRVMPSRNITWFQANEACAASGKHLANREEWLLAVQGTPDPGDSNGNGGACRTGGGATDARPTGQGTECESAWGAQDMIGNVWEWTAEWYAGLGNDDMNFTPWPDPSYGTDTTVNIISKEYPGIGGPVQGLPAAALRGGDWRHGTGSGAFALTLEVAPSGWHFSVGFRCVVRR